MIALAVLASALAAAMFWSPNFERQPEPATAREKVWPAPADLNEPIASTKLEDKTIRIYLGDLGLEELGQLARLYEGTPLYHLISEYYEAVEEELARREEAEKRGAYMNRLNSAGYRNELLAPLGTGTLEQIIRDLE